MSEHMPPDPRISGRASGRPGGADSESGDGGSGGLGDGGGATLASDAERDAAVRSLAAHFADGRLRREELDQRVDVALAARTRGQLRALFADLPVPPSARRASPPEGTRRARPTAPTVLILAVLVAFALTAALHGVFPVPLIPVFLLLARRLRHLPRQARPWH